MHEEAGATGQGIEVARRLNQAFAQRHGRKAGAVERLTQHGQHIRHLHVVVGYTRQRFEVALAHGLVFFQPPHAELRHVVAQLRKGRFQGLLHFLAFQVLQADLAQADDEGIQARGEGIAADTQQVGRRDDARAQTKHDFRKLVIRFRPHGREIRGLLVAGKPAAGLLEIDIGIHVEALSIKVAQARRVGYDTHILHRGLAAKDAADNIADDAAAGTAFGAQRGRQDVRAHQQAAQAADTRDYLLERDHHRRGIREAQAGVFLHDFQAVGDRRRFRG
ncbi:hypothetical protein D3C72_1474220 [compost metagenome]